MQLFSSDPDVPGVFAVGQVATGIFVLAQFGTGVVVVAQFGRGVFVLAQFGIGFIVIGQFAAGVIKAGGMFAAAARTWFGLALFPRLRSPRAKPKNMPAETPLAKLVEGDVDEGWVRVRVVRESDRLVVRALDAFGREQPLDATMDAGVVRALGAEADAGRTEALVGLLAETQRDADSAGFRAAPKVTRKLSVQAVHAIVSPGWQTPFLGAQKDDATKPMSPLQGSVRLTLWLGLCVGWWLLVGQSLVAMFR